MILKRYCVTVWPTCLIFRLLLCGAMIVRSSLDFLIAPLFGGILFSTKISHLRCFDRVKYEFYFREVAIWQVDYCCLIDNMIRSKLIQKVLEQNDFLIAFSF